MEYLAEIITTNTTTAVLVSAKTRGKALAAIRVKLHPVQPKHIMLSTISKAELPYFEAHIRYLNLPSICPSKIIIYQEPYIGQQKILHVNGKYILFFVYKMAYDYLHIRCVNPLFYSMIRTSEWKKNGIVNHIPTPIHKKITKPKIITTQKNALQGAS